MAVNKVDINGATVIDLTGDSVTPATLKKGETAHNAAGEQIIGTMEAGGGTSGSQTGVVDTSASYRIIYTYFPDAVSVTVPTRVVTATSASGELQA